MPYVQGQTLKQILKRASQQEKAGEKMDHLADSIPALIRIFLSICQAVAYAHSKKVLHRDLKPENIIVGQYGQIVILDWGLAKIIKARDFDFDEEKEIEPPPSLNHLTHLGKVVGTISYMAPERALGHPANFQTDIYSLGVILYQLLTLKLPFYRPSLKEFRDKMFSERVIDPAELAPYRDIPRSLSRVVMKCLASNTEQRYQSVDDLIRDLENYIEGRSDWFQMAELNIQNKTDWEFQEHVFIGEHIALPRETELSEWVNLMISKASFQENIKIEASIKIGEQGNGIGFLLSIPESTERRHLNDGYCLWLGTDSNRTTKLLRSTVEVMHAPDLFLRHNEWEKISIEKIYNNIHVYLNNSMHLSYISHLPLSGTHVGLLSRDADFSIKDFVIYVGSQNVTVNCLAVPDAFLAHNDYDTALSEYRRIGYSFPGRAEGREAMFRAGITLLEQAKAIKNEKEKADLYDRALEEFEKLHNTPGAPLEYLGKALVYQSEGDTGEEAKCFELAYRRYPKHPLLPVLQEQLIFRLHDSARYDRQATFNFFLLVIKYLPKIASNKNNQKLQNSIERHWEPLFFIEEPESDAAIGSELRTQLFGLKLAFWLARHYVLSELAEEMMQQPATNEKMIGNVLFSLIELGARNLAEAKFEELLNLHAKSELKHFGFDAELFEICLKAHKESLESAIEAWQDLGMPMGKQGERTLLFLMQFALDCGMPALVHTLYQQTDLALLAEEGRLLIEAHEIWALLMEKKWEQAGSLLHRYPVEMLSQESSILHFLYGCWLYPAEGKEIASIHFSGALEILYPRTWMLCTHFLKGKITENSGWMRTSFLWERRQLYRQLTLYYSCTDEEDKAYKYRNLALQEVVDAD